jgi:hypothetical protein
LKLVNVVHTKPLCIENAEILKKEREWNSLDYAFPESLAYRLVSVI